MVDPPRGPDSNGGNPGVGLHSGQTAGTPLWVKVFGIIAVVAILLFVLLHITRGPHRPGRHMHGSSSGYTPPSSVTERGVQKPWS
jgi:hypothetical protein